MQREYWQRQDLLHPLFSELLWSRPENRQFAGKLLVVGGNVHGFAAPGLAYDEAVKVGVGTARVLLPDALQKTVGRVFEAGEFAPSTPASGSFSQKALDEWLAQAHWADGVLIAGDLGRNAETAILLEKFLSKHSGQVTLTKDAVDYATSSPHAVLARPETLLVLGLGQLQRLGSAARATQAIAFGMDLLHLVDWLHAFTLAHAPHLIVKHLDHFFVAANGQVSTTKLESEQELWRVATAARASVWWLQNPSYPFESLTTSLIT